MKREQYQITSTVGHNVIKLAWNSSIREIEKLVGAMANKEGYNYHLTDKGWIKDGYDILSGFREWTRSDGVVITFNVERIA